MRYTLLALIAFMSYGCASSSRVDMLADQVKANQLNIRTMQDMQNDYETNILNIHNRLASNDAKISDLAEEQKKLKNIVDSKFRQNLMK